MADPNTNFRLGNQIVLVEGRHAAALYDLFRGRVQRLSLHAAGLLKQPEASSDASDPQARASLLQSLSDRGYLEPVTSAQAEALTVDWTVPLFPSLRTLSFDIDEATDASHLALVEDLAGQATAGHSLLNVILVVGGSPGSLRSLTENLLALDGQLMVELTCADEAWLALDGLGESQRLVRIGELPRGDCPDYDFSKKVRTVAPENAPISTSLFLGNYDYFHLLKDFSESYGCLHVDSSLRVFPDICERSFVIADLRVATRSVASLVHDERTQHYWRSGKQGREKCRDCEYRFVCPNPAASRSDPDDLQSAPRNCSYDLASGTWGSMQ